jgi:putative ABC transport system ATP-binding protein
MWLNLLTPRSHRGRAGYQSPRWYSLELTGRSPLSADHVAVPYTVVMSAASDVFRLISLRKTYGSGEAAVHALRGVDLTISEGELVVLLGPSGSGKSTLLNVIGGLDRPTSGQSFFRESDLATASDAEVTTYRRLHVGFVFQFYNLIASLTAEENVDLVTEVATDPMPSKEALELVGLGARLHHFPAQLSGGEQQRVAIARAIAKRPTVLLCDEPTGALDVATGAHVLDALVTANEKLRTTTLLITHNADIARIGDRVVRFADGLIRSIERNPRRIPPRELNW